LRPLLKYLLDTNVISEMPKPRPNPKVTNFLASSLAQTACISVMTLGELRKGVRIKVKTDPSGAARLALWIDELEHEFSERVLAIDAHVSRIWGELSAERSRSVIDALLAATALANGLTLVTRNTKDFRGIDGLPLLNPWDG
jgi:toxin FitB